MARRPPTRETLLETGREITAVRYGKNLLEKKRDALLKALEEDRRKFKELDAEFRNINRRISLTYSLVRMYEGHSMLLLLKPDLSSLKIRVKKISLMGCKYSIFTPSRSQSGVGPQINYDPALTSLYVDDFLNTLSDSEKILWSYINLKTKITSLEKELDSTMLKINTLEHIILPDLKKERSKIAETIAERERQERYAIKKMSRKKQYGG